MHNASVIDKYVINIEMIEKNAMPYLRRIDTNTGKNTYKPIITGINQSVPLKL
jgi:hypothetical protein